MSDIDIGWSFPGNNNGREDGINNSGIETFSNNPLASLAREIIQNSLDARDDSQTESTPVEVVFDLKSIQINEIPGHQQIVDIHKRCKEAWSGNSPADKFFARSLSFLQQDKIDVLVASDFNTKGLLGEPEKRGSDWYNLVKSVGSSDKGSAADGSFGIGKNAPFACSALRMVFYRTLNLDGWSGQQGISMLVTHADENNENTQGTGYYGNREKNGPYAATNGIFSIEPRDKTGTDVFIVGFPHRQTWEKLVAKAAIESFFMAITKGHLNIKVGETYITKTSIAEYIERIVAEEEFWPFALYHDSLVSPDQLHFIEPDFQGLGQVELFLLPDQKGMKRVAMTRRSGMLIYEKGHFRTPIRFAGIFHATGEDINGLLRSLEPPEHNDWVSTRDTDDPDYAQKIKKKLYEWINSKVRELSEQETGDEVDMEGISKYLPDELEEIESTVGERLSASLELEPKDVSVDIKKSEPSRLETRRAKDTGGSEGDDLSTGEGDEGQGEGEPVGNNDGDGGIPTEGTGDLSGGGEGGGPSESDAGRERGSVAIPVQISNLRTFSLDAEGAKYQVSFTPDRSGNGRIEVRAVGESGIDKLDVAGACLVGQRQDFEVDQDGRIYNLEFKKDERIDLQVSLKDAERVALEVAAYAD